MGNLTAFGHRLMLFSSKMLLKSTRITKCVLFFPSVMAIEQTFAMVKPDGVRRGLVGRIVERIEAKGYRLVAMELMSISHELAEKHYGEHAGKPFYENLVNFITSGPVLTMVLEGEDVINGWRTMMGVTNPSEAHLGTIRGDYATTIDENVVHGSDSPETAEREIGIFFHR